LSPRTIDFVGEEMLWECHEDQDCECGQFMYCGRPSLPLPGENCDVITRKWHIAVNKYSRLDLTFTSDAFPALSGVAHVFAKCLDDEYLAGLWKKNLVADLLWYRNKTEPYLENPVPTTWRAPSWSWASTDFSNGSVDFISLGSSMVEAHEAVVERLCEDPNGEVASELLA
jgi:hypothetical protein